MNKFRTLITATLALCSFVAFASAPPQERIKAQAATTSASETKRSATIAGQLLQPGVEMLIAAESWGETKQDVEAAEAYWIQRAGGRIQDHSNRIHGRTPRTNGLQVRLVKGTEIVGLGRKFTIYMVYRISGRKEEWCVGTIDPGEILLGDKIGMQVFKTLCADGRVKTRTVLVWKVNAAFWCNNDCQGKVYTESTRMEWPVVVKEEKTITNTHTYREVAQKQTQNQTQIQNVYVTNITMPMGQGLTMSPISMRTSAPIAGGTFFFQGSGTSGVIYCPPGVTITPPPILPPPIIGTPPNRDNHYNGGNQGNGSDLNKPKR